MVKNEIQEQRMREYFICATAEILKGEGLKSVSVRNVAERAGYSYATMYNYFKDVKSLVFECVKDFSEELLKFVDKKEKAGNNGLEKIRDRMMAYAAYFLEYPGIFELFFLERPSEMGSQQPVVNTIWSLPDRVCSTEWDALVENGSISLAQARDMSEALKYEITGLLLFYLNRNKPSRYDGFIELLNSRIEKTLGIVS